MRLSGLKSVTAAAAALALCFSPTMAAAATAAPAQSMNPLVAISVFGTQASAQQVCNPAVAAAAAGAVAAQAPTGCVLPATDVPAPLPPQAVGPVAASSGFGIAPIILGLLGIAALAALIASGGDDNDNDAPVSPN
jgi:hypothetical protein